MKDVFPARYGCAKEGIHFATGLICQQLNTLLQTFLVQLELTFLLKTSGIFKASPMEYYHVLEL